MSTPIEKLAKHTNAILIPCKDREQWLAERTKSIGGSESPSIMGAVENSAWSSPLSIWADKVSPPTFRESTERQELGLLLEPVVCDLYRKKWGGQVEQWPAHTIARDAQRPYIHATPDATLFENGRPGPGSLSIKTWSEFDQRAWEKEPPLYAQVQLQQELAVLGWQWGYIAVLFGSQRLERYYVERNEYFIRELFNACGEFWRHVVDKTEPPIDESRATAMALARLHPDDSGLAVKLPLETDSLMIELENAKDTIKAAERIKDRCENQIKALIGDDTFGVSPEGRIYSWKSQDRKDKCCEECGAVVTPGTTFRVLRSTKSLPKGTPFSDAVIDYKGSARKQFPVWIKQQMLEADPHCKWCRCTLTDATATIEHITPLAVGGTNERNNLALACEGCNQARGHDATLTAEQIVAKKNAKAVPLATSSSLTVESPANV